MPQNFLLTYSVKAESDHEADKQKATKVRTDIADIEIWEKTSDVETTFMGSMVVSGFSDDAKKASAIKQVSEQFLPVLKNHKAQSDHVKIYCVMMLKNVDMPFDFIIKW